MISDNDIINIAKANNLEPAAVKAVMLVESSGNGMLLDGKPKILFEGHIFWHQLYLLGSNPNAYVLGNENILYPTWDTTKYAGGSTPEQRGQGEWLRLEKAELINIEAALRSASWGLFQIMGFNFHPCGFNNVNEYVTSASESEANQLTHFINFIKNDSGGNKYYYLQKKDWVQFAKAYNGRLYAQNKYDIILAQKYQQSLNLNQ